MKTNKLLALILALVLAIAPVTVFADGEEPPKYDMDPAHLTFASQDDADALIYRPEAGKSPARQTEYAIENGELKLVVSDADPVQPDPYIYFTLGKLKSTIKAEDYPYCVLIYKVPSTTPAVPIPGVPPVTEIFFMTDGAAAAAGMNLPVFVSPSDKYESVMFNPGALDSWQGDVSALRLDYFAIATDGDTMYVHDVMFFADEATAKSETKAILDELNLPDELTLSFNVGDHGDPIEDQTVKKHELPVRPADPTADGFVFDGWYTTKSLSTEYKFDSPLDQETVTVYAKWVKANVVTFDSGEGSAVANQNVKRNGRAVEPEAPEREGYAFGGWYTDEACTAAYDFSKLVKESFTLYAKWDKLYDVKVNNGTADVGKAPAGAKITVTANAAPEGKSFDHWEFVSGGETISDGEAKSETYTFRQTEGGCEITAVFKSNAALLGDVNGDGKINAKDVTAIMKHIIGKTPEDFDLDAADFNGDGKINAKDVTGIMKRIVSGK